MLRPRKWIQHYSDTSGEMKSLEGSSTVAAASSRNAVLQLVAYLWEVSL